MSAAAAPFSLSSSDTARACAAATGFDFRLGTSPSSAQLRDMCGQDDCIQQVNLSLLRARNSPSRSELELRQLREFAYVVVDFCYYYREPGTPCAGDFLAQFMIDLKPLVAACEAKSGFSFAGAAGASSDIADVCGVDECDNVIRRLFVKPMIRSCEPVLTNMGKIPAEYEAVMSKWVHPYQRTCPVANSPTWYLSPRYFSSVEAVKYVYLPGPLPAAPLTTAPPPPTNTTEKPSAPPTTPTPTPEATNGTTIADDASTSGSGDRSTPANVFPVVAEVSPSASVDAAVPRPIQVAETTSRTRPLVLPVVLSVAAVGVVLLGFILYRRRQRRQGLASLKAGNAYSAATDSSHSSSSFHSALTASCEIPIEQLDDIRIIGGGGSGIVYLVRDTGNNNRLLASKRLNRNNISDDQIDAFVAEIALASSLTHPRIVQFIAIAGLHKSDVQGLFEYMPGGDLCRYLSLLPPIDTTRHSWTPEKLQIAIDVADALAYIHSREPTPIVHRDLKSRNVMLTSDHRAKLGDFGISRAESAMGSMTTGVGTTRWVAPEVILGGGDYSTACDIYSFGVVLTELDTHRLPFSELVNADGDQLADFVVLELVATQRQQPSLSGTCPDGIRELASRCLSFEPSDRPTAQEMASMLRHIQDGVVWGKAIEL